MGNHPCGHCGHSRELHWDETVAAGEGQCHSTTFEAVEHCPCLQYILPTMYRTPVQTHTTTVQLSPGKKVILSHTGTRRGQQREEGLDRILDPLEEM